jgi:hypothetical protein
MELSRDEEQRKRERAWIYGEKAQPRSHLVKERLMYMDCMWTMVVHILGFFIQIDTGG